MPYRNARAARRLPVLPLLLVLCALGAARPALAGPDEDALARIEYDFANMQITKDSVTIERVAAVMDERFRFTDPARRDWGASKDQILMTIRSEKLVVTSTTFRPFTVRVFGSTAIVEGVNSSTGTFDGRDIGGTFAWVDVFEKRDGRWVWLFSQSGFVGDKLSDKDPCDVASCPGLQPGFSLGK
jgi:hypothetical protein